MKEIRRPYEYEIKVKCSNCDGTGQATSWDGDKREEFWRIEDCPVCEAKGFLLIKVKDFRRIATKKSALLPDKY